MMDEEEVGLGSGLAVIGRAVIDTRPPFKSVKEAVMLFGERVLTGEVVAPRLKQMREEKVTGNSDGLAVSWKALSSVLAELKETRGSLSEAQEENKRLANRNEHLKQELNRATREIEWLKLERFKVEFSPRTNPEIDAEDIKFVENVTQQSVEAGGGEGRLLEVKQKSVKFASPPLLTRVITDKAETVEVPNWPSSTNGTRKRMTKKGVISAITRLFSKRYGGGEEGDVPIIMYDNTLN